ncbi:hypothetical protein [Candidatus Nitrosocosmicus hydrocola]|uniref:hypothetical protein n=1 Tax=Candidatus Nitrosocosmicus hydrocola TaxID=1826872 RepID=UPI0011E5B96E|nr:hypothetical protein [Candidatus Nitrosocosmicus hydrocola]
MAIDLKEIFPLLHRNLKYYSHIERNSANCYHIVKLAKEELDKQENNGLITRFYDDYRYIFCFNKNINISAIVTPALPGIVIVLVASTVFHSNNFLIFFKIIDFRFRYS